MEYIDFCCRNKVAHFLFVFVLSQSAERTKSLFKIVMHMRGTCVKQQTNWCFQLELIKLLCDWKFRYFLLASSERNSANMSAECRDENTASTSSNLSFICELCWAKSLDEATWLWTEAFGLAAEKKGGKIKVVFELEALVGLWASATEQTIQNKVRRFEIVFRLVSRYLLSL